ncbi:MAG: hypothetical protein N2Z58_03285 [Fervidobacterium sp.]|nr:hypothetical protein [Fervidobacterium sp.]
MEKEELEKKLFESLEKLDEHIERYERDIQELNFKIERLRNDIDDTWSTLRTAFITMVVIFAIMAITWFFPFQVRAYGYLSPDDVRRKLIALSVEALFFGIIMLFVLSAAFLRRFRK